MPAPACLLLPRTASWQPAAISWLTLPAPWSGEGWRQLMNDCKLSEPHCTIRPLDGSPSDCGFQVGSSPLCGTLNL